MDNRSLPLILADAANIAAQLAEAEGELTPEMESLVESSAHEIAAKADRYMYVLQALEAQMQIAEERANEWKALLFASEKAIKNLKNRLLHTMTAAGLQEITGYETTWRMQANPPSVIIEDENKLPGQFIVIETPPPIRKIDKKLIADFLKKDQVVPGAHLERTYRVVPKVTGKKLGGK